MKFFTLIIVISKIFSKDENGNFHYEYGGIRLIRHGTISTYYPHYDYSIQNPPDNQ